MNLKKMKKDELIAYIEKLENEKRSKEELEIRKESKKREKMNYYFEKIAKEMIRDMKKGELKPFDEKLKDIGSALYTKELRESIGTYDIISLIPKDHQISLDSDFNEAKDFMEFIAAYYMDAEIANKIETINKKR